MNRVIRTRWLRWKRRNVLPSVAGTVPPGRAGSGGHMFWSEETRFAWLSLMPALLFFAVFVVFPVVYSFYLSFPEWNRMSPQAEWVGLANYAALVRDDTFLRSPLQTSLFTAGSTGCIVVFSLLTALLPDQKLKQFRLYRTIYYLPAVTSVVAIGIVWLWIFDPDYGLINEALKALGLIGPRWLADTSLTLPSLIITAAWRNIGYGATDSRCHPDGPAVPRCGGTAGRNPDRLGIGGARRDRRCAAQRGIGQGCGAGG